MRYRDFEVISLPLILFLFLGPGHVASADDGTPPGWKELVEPVISEGGVGAVFFPGRWAGGEIAEVIDPAGARVHLTNPREPMDHRVLPAGRYVVPPRGRWRVWLEDGDRITPYARLVTFPRYVRGRPAPNILPLEPGGRVTLPEGIPTPSGSTLSVLVADPPPWGGPNEFLRVESAHEVGSGILMPARSAVASLWSSGDEELLALSPPFPVLPGVTIPAPLERPAAEEAFLAVYLERAQDSSAPGSLAELSLEVSQGSEIVPADVLVPTEWGVYGYWYSLAPGAATLTGGSATTYVEPHPIELAGGEIAHREGAILDRPLLEVTLVLPSRLREQPLHLAVWRMPEEIELASAELTRSTSRHRFHRDLMAGTLEVRLHTHLGELRRRVELQPGEEGFVGLEPERSCASSTPRPIQGRDSPAMSFPAGLWSARTVPSS